MFQDLGFSEFADDIELNENSRVVDIGAWKGEFSEYIKEKYKCEVEAYEPSGEYGTPKAVWIYNGTVPYKRLRGSDNRIGEGEETVECVDIKDITNKHIDLLKVNIEGAEIEVLDRANLDNIDQILVEFHEWIGLVSKEEVDKIVTKIINKGYEFKRTDKHPDYFFKRTGNKKS